MAIAFDAAGGGVTTGGSVTSTSWSHTCASGATLYVFIYNDDITDRVTGVTYNGVAMTRKVIVNAAQQTVYLYFLSNPATGANTLAVTSSAANQLGGKSFSYTGASTTQVDSSNSGTSPATGSTFSISTTVVASNCWVIGCSRDDAGGASPNNFTVRGATVNTMTGGDTNTTVSSGSNTLIWNKDPAATMTAIVASIQPAGGAVAKSGFLFMM